jgi:hypothetical protein
VWDSVITNQIISQGDMSNFVQSFAERKDTTDEKTLKLILDSVTFVLGLGSAVVWNDSEILSDGPAKITMLTRLPSKSSKRPRSFHVSISPNISRECKANQITEYLNKAKGQRFPSNGKAPEGAKPSEGNSRSVWKDVSSASIAYGMVSGKDSLYVQKTITAPSSN